MSWHLTISYPVDGEMSTAEVFAPGQAIQTAVGESRDVEMSGSGCGFGARDLDWYCATKEVAEAAADRARRAVPETKLSVEILEEDDMKPMTDDEYNATVEVEPKTAEDLAIDAQLPVLDAALDWTFADGPNAQAEALERLYRAVRAYAPLAEAAWGDGTSEQ